MDDPRLIRVMYLTPEYVRGRMEGASRAEAGHVFGMIVGVCEAAGDVHVVPSSGAGHDMSWADAMISRIVGAYRSGTPQGTP